MPRKGKSKYTIYLEMPDVKRWHTNMTRGSPITAEVALRRLSRMCELLDSTPSDIVDRAKGDMKGFQDSLEDLVTRLESEGKSPGYILDLLKTVKSWLRYHDLTLKRRIKVSNPNATPTIEEEQIPSKEELSRILRASNPRVRTAETLIAFADLRPQTLGNHNGSDGLKIGRAHV